MKIRNHGNSYLSFIPYPIPIIYYQNFNSKSSFSYMGENKYLQDPGREENIKKPENSTDNNTDHEEIISGCASLQKK